jgi:oligoendopeptidase F
MPRDSARDAAISRPLAARDAADRAGGADALGPLPEWRLEDLYAGPDDPAMAQDLKAAADEARAMAADYEGKLAGLDGDALAQAVGRYERIESKLGRIMSYVGLRYQQNTADPARAKQLGDMQGSVTDATTPLVFFTLELNRIEDAALSAALESSEALRRWKPWIERVRAFRPHQLSDELERYEHDRSVVGVSSWVRLYDETTAALTFDVDGDTLSLEQTLNLLSHADRARREAGAKALTAVFRDNLRLFTLIMNTLVKEKEIDDRWRKYPAPQSVRHLANQVEPEVVEALDHAVREAHPRLSHRYYALKARWMGMDRLAFWDRNAPLPEADDRPIPWGEARETVLGAFAGFSPRMADLAAPFFDKGWIDAPVKSGKSPGAFAHPTVADAHPYVMLNYMGKTRDVMTLAHELGHGVHQRLAAEQGELLSRTPLTLAETASVFGEMLTFQRLLAATDDPRRRKALLAGKVEDMLNTVVRQMAFYRFESRVHAERRKGELTSEDLGAIWMEVQAESLGPAIALSDGYETYWTYIPHFIHTPFYVYAYAFGDGLVNALYAVYRDSPDGFQDRYFDLLRAGGTKDHRALLAPFGLNAGDPDFWAKGLGLIAEMIDGLEALDGA